MWGSIRTWIMGLLILENNIDIIIRKITRWRSWLRQCARSRKVAGSIPDGVTGILR
jgi:hypothetical protein